MREFELVIDEAFQVGLSPEEITPFNTQVLRECLGFKVGKLGLEAYITLDNPINPAVDMKYNWPFPQFIAGELYNILVIRDDNGFHDLVYSVSDDHWTVTQIADVDTLIYGQGGLMEVADFGEYIFMTNGAVIIYWNVALTAWTITAATPTIPMMKTICNFKGQAVGGNISGVWHDCDETYYVWSKIGSIDFTPDNYNEAGYRRCPYGGEVYHTKRYGDSVIGYSSKGITIISPVTSPVPSFGFAEASDIGLINKGAMNGNLNRHIYVGEDYILRELSPTSLTTERGGIKELGYQQYMEELAGEDIIVSYEPKEKDFYIGNSTKTFLLSPKGLTEIQQHPSAVWRRDKESYMLPAAIDIFSPLISTSIFDMGYKGQKTVFTVETDALLNVEPEVSVDWANDLIMWGYGSYTPINNMGIASMITSGNLFMFNLKFGSIYDIFRISYLKARYKMTDLRGIRGVYAPPPRGQINDN